jgi:hypothetical protein
MASHTTKAGGARATANPGLHGSEGRRDASNGPLPDGAPSDRPGIRRRACPSAPSAGGSTTTASRSSYHRIRKASTRSNAPGAPPRSGLPRSLHPSSSRRSRSFPPRRSMTIAPRPGHPGAGSLRWPRWRSFRGKPRSRPESDWPPREQQHPSTSPPSRCCNLHTRRPSQPAQPQRRSRRPRARDQQRPRRPRRQLNPRADSPQARAPSTDLPRSRSGRRT